MIDAVVFVFLPFLGAMQPATALPFLVWQQFRVPNRIGTDSMCFCCCCRRRRSANEIAWGTTRIMYTTYCNTHSHTCFPTFKYPFAESHSLATIPVGISRIHQFPTMPSEISYATNEMQHSALSVLCMHLPSDVIGKMWEIPHDILPFIYSNKMSSSEFSD